MQDKKANRLKAFLKVWVSRDRADKVSAILDDLILEFQLILDKASL